MTVIYDTAYFIERAIKKHGNKYDYSKSVYTRSKDKVIIRCRSCDITFQQVAMGHLLGGGCASCYKKKHLLTQEDFVNRSVRKHGDKYGYHKAVFVSSSSKVEIYCRSCDEYFMQTPISHYLAGQGCGKCGIKSSRLTQEQFIAKAKQAHPDGAYDYSSSVFTGTANKVTIICNRCNGMFHQVGADHLRGRGCKPCSMKDTGYTRTDFISASNRHKGRATLYVIKCLDGDSVFYKVGITARKVRRRFTQSYMPFSYELTYEIKGDASYIYDLETQLHRLLKHKKYKPSLDFHGQTECFTTIKPVEQLLKRLSSTEQLQLIA